MRRNHTSDFLIGLVAMSLTASAIAAPIGTAFTYQGQLKNAGSPVNGNTTMAFSLWDAATGGAQQGSTLTFTGGTAVNVSSGLFTVQLDFGVNPYTANAARWLEISVNGTTLTPRQPLTPAPAALNTRGINVGVTGNVGIGTTNPAGPLHVRGSNPFPHLKVEADSAAPYGAFLSLDASATTGGKNWHIFSTGGTAGEGLGKLVFQDFSDGLLNTMALTSAGRVGIGTTNPVAGLQVATDIALGQGLREMRIQEVHPSDPGWGGFIAFDGIGIGSNTGTTRQMLMLADGNFYNSALTLATSTDSGANWKPRLTVMQGTDQGVGINTAAPFGELGLGDYYPGTIGSVVGTYSKQLVLGGAYNTGYNTGNAVKLLIAGYDNDATATDIYPIYVEDENNNVDFYLRDQAGTKTAYFGGEVTCKVLNITGADLAEKMPTCEPAKPGMVMEIDPEHAGQLKLAQGVYNTRVAGVVSGAGDIPTGTVLGNMRGFEDAPAVALSGRVYTWCDASSGPIRPGDLLTTSDTPGYAMKAADSSRAHGATIGKAMSVLDRGEGLVLVLVNLQ